MLLVELVPWYYSSMKLLLYIHVFLLSSNTTFLSGNVSDWNMVWKAERLTSLALNCFDSCIWPIFWDQDFTFSIVVVLRMKITWEIFKCVTLLSVFLCRFQDQLQLKFQELCRLNLLWIPCIQIMARFVGCRILDHYTQDLRLIHIRLQVQRQLKLQVQAHLVRLHRGGKPQYHFQMEFLHVKFVKSTAKLGSIC